MRPVVAPDDRSMATTAAPIPRPMPGTPRTLPRPPSGAPSDWASTCWSIASATPWKWATFSLATPRAEVADFMKSLEADPHAVSPEKLVTAPSLLQAMSGYSACGIRQMAILMGKDAGLPLGGPGFDSRTPEQDLKDLTATTEALKGYPAFRGWSWASNWWVFGDRGAAAAKTRRREGGLRGGAEEGGRHRRLGRRARQGRRLSALLCRRCPGDVQQEAPGVGAGPGDRRGLPVPQRRVVSARSRWPTSMRATCRPSGSRSSCRTTARSASISTSGRARGPGAIRRSGTTPAPATRSSPRSGKW